MITPVLLCGGSGTRLWPLSRQSYPKQFASIVSNKTLFQASAARLRGEEYSQPVVITSADYRFIAAQQLQSMGVTPGTILLEPEGRNTAPAVLATALHLAQTDSKGLMLIAPADHVVQDDAAFRTAVRAAVPTAQDGDLVTFGITPTRAETGYGYLELQDNAQDGLPQPLAHFVEKPDAKRAQEMLDSGSYLWNAGIFLFRVDVIIDAFETHAPDMVTHVRLACENAQTELDFVWLDHAPWAKVDDISIDYAVMEKASNLSVVPFSAGWSDLGGWDAVWSEMDQNETQVATWGPAEAINCTDTLLRSETENLQLVGIGLEDIVAVAMPDAVLVAKKSNMQDDLKTAVSLLKSKDVKQATQFPKDNRPWGWFESLLIGKRFQVKCICVHPGAALSLQSHHHRAEHWIVVEGTARVTMDEEVKLVTENQSVYIPLGAVHRMENPGKIPMVLIEVQTGSYLGEDDIIRYEDIYARN